MKPRMIRRPVSFLLIAAHLVVARPGQAQAGDQQTRHETFLRGVRAGDAKDWATALAIFQGLWNQEKSHDVAVSLGQAELQLKFYRQAAEHLAFGVRNAPPNEEPSRVKRAQHMFELARKEVGTIELHVNPAKAEVLVDGTLAATDPLPSELFIDPGSHVVEAQSSGYKTARQTIEAVAGQRNDVELNLAADENSGPPPASSPTSSTPPASLPAENDTPDQSHETGPNGARTAVLVAGAGVTVVALGIGIGYALRGSSAGSDADDARAHATVEFGIAPCATSAGQHSAACDSLRSALDRRETSDRIANTSFLIAGVAGVSTALIFALWPAHRNPQTGRALRMSPLIGRSSAGAVVTLGF